MAYVKSVFWLLACGGLGYGLLRIVTPSDSDLVKYLPEGQVHHKPDAKKRAGFVEVLKQAAAGKDPMNRQTGEKIDPTISKAQINHTTAAK